MLAVAALPFYEKCRPDESFKFQSVAFCGLPEVARRPLPECADNRGCENLIVLGREWQFGKKTVDVVQAKRDAVRGRDFFLLSRLKAQSALELPYRAIGQTQQSRYVRLPDATQGQVADSRR